MNNKLITIITVVYNSVDLIEDTIKSVIQHNSSDFEYVVIDGGSTDGTIQIIEKYLNQISVFISEPDKGIYDAINKGIHMSTGKFIGFINCGDQLLRLPLKELLASESSFINCFPVLLSNGANLVPVNNWTLKIRNTLPHQGCFYRKTDELIYDTKYEVFSDFNLNQNIYKNKHLIKCFNGPIVAFHDMGGISHNKKHSGEIFKVVKDNFGLCFQMISFLYFKKQGLVQKINNILNQIK